MGRSAHGRVLIGALADRMQDILLYKHGEDDLPSAGCVMPNHVHVMAQPRARQMLKALVQSWKSIAAPAPHAPKPLWQKNYLDRFMRDEDQVWFTANYIEANPVAAGLVERADEWRWSSAWRG